MSEKRIKSNMRKIGHEVLKCIGDESSRVLAIRKTGNQYKIPFEAKLSFDPDDIVSTIDRVMKETKLASHYFVEVEQCESNSLVHSYEISHTSSLNNVACIGRVLPYDCYSLIVTIVDDKKTAQSLSVNQKSNAKSIFVLAILFLSLLGFLSFVLYKKKQRANNITDRQRSVDQISIGSFRFDQKNMILISANEHIELSTKEAQLLSVLHNSSNTTVQREILLQKVWKDEGDYIGRTLDVYISKLRKKLQGDPSIKIITERGTGYRLVIND